ncbi:MAG: putative b-glycosidase, glycoside hydrolase family 8 protein, partial [Pseudomonadota bacterium]
MASCRLARSRRMSGGTPPRKSFGSPNQGNEVMKHLTKLIACRALVASLLGGAAGLAPAAVGIKVANLPSLAITAPTSVALPVDLSGVTATSIAKIEVVSGGVSSLYPVTAGQSRQMVPVKVVAGGNFYSIRARGNSGQILASTNLTLAGTALPVGQRISAYEGLSAQTSTLTDVQFGTGVSWVKKAIAGKYTCDASTFGSDPFPEVQGKICVALNKFPVVSWVWPMNNSLLYVSDNNAISVSASDQDTGISRVEFFVNGSSVGQLTAEPFKLIYKFKPGSYRLRVVAFDKWGASASTEEINVDVEDGANALPFSRVYVKQNNFTSGLGDVLLAADVADPYRGKVVNVEFLVNGELISGVRDVSADFVGPVLPQDGYPYTYTQAWTRVPPGTYSIVARATDNSGGVVHSLPINVVVGPDPYSPVVRLTSPTAGANYSIPATIGLSAVAK